ncbi:phosphoribosylanthranilate isomerase [Fructobacillus tropaeoli]|uniref:N-(5'-phosphoribosyl)anthranilate isomerase n=1 Tax=Fructobacillus tropaeoli TaxID=709323 RepID=A0ABM9N004_9LACO|nr:phosphoribosylanthranilate isomerase [Fructobacillus tropaeoli]GIC70757.1 phosphoribosylanthranilate isomerase [Fructobacillus tropaeoli]CAK1224618.1 Phosphoribosylanthranilate isomerase (TrpF) [Fructobacillus tropaeoli]CAK1251861.1 Phosphoribosylanthranilate isomerase (TrpF) [Fructobacillus tropaeoli]
MTKIKICGLMTKEEALMANEARPDLAGVVFAPGRHQVTAEEALVVRKALDERIPLVGVFVAEPVETILKLVETGTIQMIQLHGQRPIAEARQLQSAGVPIIQALVGDDAIDQAKDWQNQLRLRRSQEQDGGLEKRQDSNFPLANFNGGSDEKADSDSALADFNGGLAEHPDGDLDLVDFLMVDAGAGSGQRLDWQRLVGLAPTHLFVAGGIQPDNLSDLLQLYQPAFVDVSSGAETKGHKDLNKMVALVAIAHQEERK